MQQKESGFCTHMSTNSSVIPWKELAGMKSILMLSAISLRTEEITFTIHWGDLAKLSVRQNYVLYIHTKKTSLMNCDPVGGFAAGLVASFIDKSKRMNNLGSCQELEHAEHIAQHAERH